MSKELKLYLYIVFLFVNIIFISFFVNLSSAATTDSTSVTATVLQGGTFVYTPNFTPPSIDGPGRYLLGYVEVSISPTDSSYNEPYPWVMRVYTNNDNYTGGGVDRSGLVSTDGKARIPIKAWCLNFGPEGHPDDSTPPELNNDEYWKDETKAVWLRVPDKGNEGYRSYVPDSSVHPSPREHDDVILRGIDPRNATWVVDKLPPVHVDHGYLWFAIEVGGAAAGTYSGTVYFEVVPREQLI